MEPNYTQEESRKITETLRAQMEKLYVPSALPTPEPQGQSARSSRATGSNPGLSAEGLAYLWEQEAHALRSAADRNCRTMRTAHAILYGKAEQLEKCAEELRRQQALPTSRQPESNDKASQRRT